MKITPLVQRQVEEEEEPQRKGEDEEAEPVQVQAKVESSNTHEVDSSVEGSINSVRIGGSPMPESLRAYYEPRFGYDFGNVRLHTYSRAAETARSMNAQAFTLGSNIVFGPGRYRPETSEGKSLLAHELTHVIQQNQKVVNKNCSAGMVQAAFENEPISACNNADTLVTRIQGILREWKSECQEGVNDFVHAELAARIDALESGSWQDFVIALIGNTIWAASAFLPLVLPAGPIVATATFAMSMAGVAINAAPSIPSASSEGKNLIRISRLLKNYYGDVFTGLLNQVNSLVTRYVRKNPTRTGKQALISFLNDNFIPQAVNTSGTPNINGNKIRAITRRKAADLFTRYRRQVVSIGSSTVVGNRTDPVDRQIIRQTGIVWARHANRRRYLTLIDIETSRIGGRIFNLHYTPITFRSFIDKDLKKFAIRRAKLRQPRGIQTLPWDRIKGIPRNVPGTSSKQKATGQSTASAPPPLIIHKRMQYDRSGTHTGTPRIEILTGIGPDSPPGTVRQSRILLHRPTGTINLTVPIRVHKNNRGTLDLQLFLEGLRRGEYIHRSWEIQSGIRLRYRF